ncbi:hypothetical protein T03_14538, partial [Trichinella britovi]
MSNVPVSSPLKTRDIFLHGDSLGKWSKGFPELHSCKGPCWSVGALSSLSRLHPVSRACGCPDVPVLQFLHVCARIQRTSRLHLDLPQIPEFYLPTSL